MSEIKTSFGAIRNIRYKRGTSFLPFTLTFKLNGTPIDLTGSTFSMKIIQKDDLTKTALITFTTGSGITMDATAGEITLEKSKADMTTGLGNTGGDYLYELDWLSATGKTSTPLSGYFIVEDDSNT